MNLTEFLTDYNPSIRKGNIMFINQALNELHLKIVYYGPGLSGKTENLNYIHKKIDPALKSDLMMLKTREDRTIFFDFIQLEVGRINGKKPKFNLYTVPGQVNYDLTRRICLNGVDGIVYVADSQIDRLKADLDTLEDLEKNLLAYGKTLENFPWVLQYNKRDLPSAAPVDLLNSKLNIYNVPYFESTAITGNGVFSTLKEVIKLTVSMVHERLKEEERAGV